MKLWKKDYTLDNQVEKFTVDRDYETDRELVKYDCLASIAHAKMLYAMNILTQKELESLVACLEEILSCVKKGTFVIAQEDEDCHTAIETYLTKKVGAAGKKIHCFRSRNDQVLTALRLYYKDKIASVSKRIETLQEALQSFKEEYGHIPMPGYTHMRKAMPSSVGLWSESFIESMDDNKIVLEWTKVLIDQSPLGTAAGYGVGTEIDRKLTANLLGFARIQINPIYVQNSRGKFESSILHALTQIMFDVNKAATDIILFSMKEYGFFELNPEICTGSSIMPHKRNPDVLEMLRGKYHEVVSNEFRVKGLAGNLPSGYNRDMQLTKEPMMKSFGIVESCLDMLSLVIRNMKVNEENCKSALVPEVYSTEKVYALVREGIPFRDAYRRVSKEYEE
jgi:argininosuccinate lyase